MEHIRVRGDFAVGGEFVGARFVGHRFADEVGEKHFVWIGEHIGLNLRFPAQAVIKRQLVRGLPTVLHKQGQFVLRDLLGARFFHGQVADAGLLQIEQNRPGDIRPVGAGSSGAGAAVGAFDVAVALLDEVEKAI